MKILVPTDFSDNANRALRFAISIINRMGGTISLYHVYRVGSSAAETFKSKLGEIILEDKNKALQETLDEYQKFVRQGSIEVHAAMGDNVDLIVDRAARGRYDLICMGLTGEGGMDEFFLGNTTLGVVRNATTPVLTIPKAAAPKLLKCIVLAVDGKGISDPNIMKQLIAFAKLNETDVKVYHHATPDESNEINPSTAKALEGLNYTYHSVVPETKDISDSIKAFVDTNNADILCLIRRKRGFLSRLFQENVTRDSMFESQVPILLVKD